MSNRMYWYIIGNLIGLLLFGLAIHFKENKRNASETATSTVTSTAPAETKSQKTEETP